MRSKVMVHDALWDRLRPLIPAPRRRRRRYPGRKPLDTRRVLSGILFVLKTGIAWDALPAELGWGCGKTCRSYLRRWQRAGVWQKLHEVLLAELHEADQIDWSRAVADSGSVRAPQGGAATGPSPTDRRKLGSKHHVIVDAQGIPLAATTTGAQRHDVTQLTTLVDRIPPVRGKRGRPRRRPKRLQGDRAYDSEPHRRELRRRGIQPVLARRRTPHGSGLGKHRWVVERTLAWLHQHGRLRRRTDRLPQIHNAFLSLASALICLNFLPP